MNNEYDNFGFNTDNSSNIKPSKIDYSKAKPKPSHLTSAPKQPVQQQPMQQPMMNQGIPQQEEVVQNEQYYSMGFNEVTPKKKNRGGGFFSFLFALLLVIGLTLFLLDYTGKVDVKKYTNKYVNLFKQKVLKKDNKSEDIENKQKALDDTKKEEIANMCSNVNEAGLYNEETVAKIKEDYESKINNSSTVNDIWNIYKGAKYCEANQCYIYEDDDSQVFYSYDCVDNEYKKSTMEESVLNERSDYYLKLACTNYSSVEAFDSEAVLSNDELKVAEGLTCEEGVCKVVISGKEFIRDCKE